MQLQEGNLTFKALRKKHPVFIFESFSIINDDRFTKITFSFSQGENLNFHPELSFPVIKNINEEELQNLAFHIGLVELISYWKASCAPMVIVKPAYLTPEQLAWWKKLWFHGLGEFFYTNGIQTNVEDFLTIRCESEHVFKSFSFNTSNDVMVPVGGGKDSVVSLELLKAAGLKVIPFILNPREASLRSAHLAGFPDHEIFSVKRTIDPLLIQLNARGYLNGHTPFSALLAFVTLLAARISGVSHIALSNEWSANEATIPGTQINHQYSKSYAFEKDFRDYVSRFISPDFNYFSFLRPLNELQIAKLFAGFKAHLQSFRSCNVGSKSDAWCGKCPKCLFTRIILGPFVENEKWTSIFGREILDDPDLVKTLDELSGAADEKPFECVGTIAEVNAALGYMIEKQTGKTLPLLLSHHRKNGGYQTEFLHDLLGQYNKQNFLNQHFDAILKRAIQ